MKQKDVRLAALYRFAAAITVFNILGHTVFGFEQSIAQPLASLTTAYFMEIMIEFFVARWQDRKPKFLTGGFMGVLRFLLPAHISGLAVAMLLYSNERLLPIMFAAAVAVGSKAILRIPVKKASRHFMNPSNTGIAVTLLLFPWVGIAPPYHFVENLTGIGDWILPAIIIISGSFLNLKLTRKIPLILGWVCGFFAQAFIRSAIFGTPLEAGLLPMTGVAFVLFTFYMVTDPPTTPFQPRNQVLFGAAVATVYGVLMIVHVVFGLFFALVTVSAVRGAYLYLAALRQEQPVSVPAPAPAVAAETGKPVLKEAR